jgi:hypothetical protein
LIEPEHRHRLAGHAAILTTVLLWGSLIPLLDILLVHFDVYALSAIRYGAAGILLLGGLVAIGFLRLCRGRLPGDRRRTHHILASGRPPRRAARG